MSRRRQLTGLESDFAEHLRQTGRTPGSVASYLLMVRRFLAHVGNGPVERISEAQAVAFFATIANKKTRTLYAMAVSAFLKFANARLPVPVTQAKRPPAPTKWTKAKSDDLTAKLARQVIKNFLFFQKLRDGDFDLDDVARLADECRELIQTNLPLFMSLSAEGQNIHPKIDERISKP